MQNVLIQTVVYVTLLGLGFGFKKAGIFRVEDSAFLKSAILYLTMPATAVNGMKALELQPSFLWWGCSPPGTAARPGGCSTCSA